MYQDRHLSIDRQAQKILVRDRLIRQLSILALALAAIAIILAIMLLAVTRAQASEACLTKAEARAKWPRAHIFWHGPQHCWNNSASRSIRFRGKHVAPDVLPVRAERNPDASGNEAKQKIMWPALVPTTEFSFQSLLVAEPMTLWPPILDVDEVTADPPECCWPKLDKDFEVRWNEMPAVWLAKLKQ